LRWEEGVELIKQLEKVIEVKNVKKIYRMGNERIYAVNDVSFDILKGEFCCLLGTSGSGKSTLLNLMAGIEKLSGGQIIIKGKRIHRMNENSLARFRQRYLGFVFQSYNLMGSMTALENVEFPLVFKRIKAKKRKSMAKEMLVKVGLSTRLAHKPKEMSGGQQQRVGIARAFVAKPEIVFADEPTGNLDTKTTMEVMSLIKSIAKDNNQTIVMVTHDRRLANFADKIIHILDGNIQNIEIVNQDEKVQELGEDYSVINAVVNQESEIKDEKGMENNNETEIESSNDSEGNLKIHNKDIEFQQQESSVKDNSEEDNSRVKDKSQDEATTRDEGELQDEATTRDKGNSEDVGDSRDKGNSEDVGSSRDEDKSRNVENTRDKEKSEDVDGLKVLDKTNNS
jgi:putative ABC transport system ATP-binding protein